MTNYTKSTDFAAKDTLLSGNPAKIVKGTEINTEFDNIATAVATKTDNSNAGITGGTINNTTIGATTPSTGAFTTLSATKATAGDVASFTNGGGSPVGLNIYSGTSASIATGATGGGESINFDAVGHNLNFYTNSSLRGTFSSTGLSVTGAGSYSGGTLTLGVQNTTDAIVNTPENMYFNVDSENTAASNYFAWAKGRSTASGGTELMRLDNSGTLGLGVTPSAWGGVKAIEVPLYGHLASAGTQLNMCHNTYYNAGYKYKTTAEAGLYIQDAGKHIWYTAPSGTAGNAITFAECGRFDTSGNLLVGATSTSGLAKSITINDGTGASAGIVYKISNSNIGYSYANPGSITIESVTGNVINCISSTAGVRLTNGATSWAAISDETQKDIIEPVTNALASVISWRKVIGKYKADAEGTRRQFLIAQDVQKTTPEAIDTDADGILSLRYTDTVPTIAASIEELNAIVVAQGASIAQLEADKAQLLTVLASVDDRLRAGGL